MVTFEEIARVTLERALPQAGERHSGAEIEITPPWGALVVSGALASGELSDAELEAGIRVYEDWRSSGGPEVLGCCDLIRRVVASVLAEAGSGA